MILDITRHKFFEGLATLLLFATVTAVVTGVSWLNVDVEGVMAPIGLLATQLSTSYPLLSIIAIVPLCVYSVLRLARATARVSIYPHGTLAAISLGAVTLMAVLPSAGYAQLMVVAMLLSEALGRLLYCFGPNIRGHYLFTSMLALGALPLVDGNLLVLSLTIIALVILLRGTPRELIIIVAGTVLSIFVCCYVEWLMDGSFMAPIYAVRDSLLASSMDGVVAYLTLPRMVYFGGLLFLMLSSVILYFGNRVSLGGGVRNVWLILQLSVIAMVVAMVGFGCASPAVMVAIAIAAVPMLPMFFICVGPLTSAIAYILYIAVAIVALC